MQYWRCQCGKGEAWESGMTPRDCEGCDECGTTFAQHLDHHKPREPHKMEPRFSERDGQPDGGRCSVCYHRDKTWSHPKEKSDA